jgi:hypothetical protein
MPKSGESNDEGPDSAVTEGVGSGCRVTVAGEGRVVEVGEGSAVLAGVLGTAVSAGLVRVGVAVDCRSQAARSIKRIANKKRFGF